MAISVLVVDDEDRVRMATRDLLAKSGFEVEAVDNASEAFRMATLREFDVIVMDLNMPGVNGLEGIRSIKLVRDGQKVVVLTGYSTDRTREQALEAGADLCLFKPEGLRTLAGEIRRLMGESADGPESNR